MLHSSLEVADYRKTLHDGNRPIDRPHALAAAIASGLAGREGRAIGIGTVVTVAVHRQPSVPIRPFRLPWRYVVPIVRVSNLYA